MTKTHYLLATALVLMLGAFVAFALLSKEQNAQASPFATAIGFTATTSTAVNVTTTSGRVLATSTNPIDAVNSHVRQYATICNPSATLVYLVMNRDIAATASTSLAIIGSTTGYPQCYEITDKNQYQGSVTAITTAGNAWVNVNDYVAQ